MLYSFFVHPEVKTSLFAAVLPVGLTICLVVALPACRAVFLSCSFGVWLLLDTGEGRALGVHPNPTDGTKQPERHRTRRLQQAPGALECQRSSVSVNIEPVCAARAGLPTRSDLDLSGYRVLDSQNARTLTSRVSIAVLILL